MLSTQISNFTDHIGRTTHPVYLQTGKIYFYGKYVNKKDAFRDSECVIEGPYDIVEIIDVNPSVNWNKMKPFVTNKDMPNLTRYSDMKFNDFDSYYDSSFNYTFFSSKIFDENPALSYNINVKSLVNGNTYVICDYTYKSEHGSIYYDDRVKPNFRMLGCCEYEGTYPERKIKQRNGTIVTEKSTEFEPSINESTISKIDSYKSELKERIIDNYKFVWANIRKNARPVKNHDTIEIDGTEFMQGLCYTSGTDREFLGVGYIPAGYRLATKDEFKKLFEQHRLLRKYIKDEKRFNTYRNDAGWEMNITRESYGYRNYEDMRLVYMYENNNINVPTHYYADSLSMYDFLKKNVFDDYHYAAAAGEDKSYYHSGLYVLVRMTKEEISEEKKLINNIIDTHKAEYGKFSLIDFYKEYGIKSFDDVKSVDFTVSHRNPRWADEKGVKYDYTFHRNASSNKLEMLKKAIGTVFENSDIFNASSIDISFGNSKMTIDNKTDVDIPTFLHTITPLMCMKACYCNFIPFRYYDKESKYFEKFFDSFDYKEKPLINEIINMNFYARAAHRSLDINTNGCCGRYGGWEESAYSLYMKSLTLNMSDGSKITIPGDAFNYYDLILSGLYSDYDVKTEEEKTYLSNMMKYVKNNVL